MSFKERVTKTASGIKQSAGNMARHTGEAIKANTIDAVTDQVKNDVQESKAYKAYNYTKDQIKSGRETNREIRKQLADLKEKKPDLKGMKGAMAKGKIIGKGIGDHLMNQTKTGRKMKEFFEKVKKSAAFIADNIKTILIVSAILIIGSTLVTFFISVGQSFGRSPHYYCEVDPDDFIKDTEFYKQYCEKNPNSFALESLNGHYIVMDKGGSGEGDVELEKACAINNMLLRFWWMNDISWYDCIWDETGKYPQEPLLNLKYTQAGNFRDFINGFDDLESTSYCSDISNGAKAFALGHDIDDWNYSTWGYLRDSSLYYSNKIDAGEGENNYDSDMWVWDISAPNRGWSLPDSTDLTFWVNSNYAFAGGDVTIKYIENTHEDTTDWPMDKVDFMNRLLGQHIYERHPEGIVCFTNNQAILITGWDSESKSFIGIDARLGTAGGFEGPVTQLSYCVYKSGEDWNAWLEDPSASPIIGFYLIEATFENNGRVTMGVTDSRALEDTYSYPNNLNPNDTVIFSAPPSELAKDAVEYATNACLVTWDDSVNPTWPVGSHSNCGGSWDSGDSDTDSGGYYPSCYENHHEIPYYWEIGDSSVQGERPFTNSHILEWDPNKADDPSIYEPSYDCIGLVEAAYWYASNGTVDCYSGTTTCYNAIPSTPNMCYVPIEEMQPGDMILFTGDGFATPSHAAMYVGPGAESNSIKLAEASCWANGLLYHDITPSDGKYQNISAVVRIYPAGECHK